MIEQRIFPFFVNGEYWKDMEVTEDIIRRGRIIIPVCSKIRAELSPSEFFSCKSLQSMKQVVFQLTEVIENCRPNSYKSYMARWHPGFWIIDKDVYLEDRNLYLKDNLNEKKNNN